MNCKKFSFLLCLLSNAIYASEVDFKDTYNKLVDQDDDHAVDIYKLYTEIPGQDQYVTWWQTAKRENKNFVPDEQQYVLDFLFNKNKILGEPFARALELSMLSGYF